VTMLTRAALQSRLHVVIEPSDQDLRHSSNDSTISVRSWAPRRNPPEQPPEQPTGARILGNLKI
jgi:hypothetical protein